MMTDALLVVAGSIVGSTVNPQSIVGSGSLLSTNVIDLSTGGIPAGQVRDIGEGSDIPVLRAQIMTAVTGPTSVEYQVIQHDDIAQSTNVTVVGTTGPIPAASMVAGARFVAQINPRIGSKGQRYLSGRWVIVGTVSTGAIFADLGIEIQDGQKFLPSGFAVL